MEDKILQALAGLSVEDDSQWTGNGLPKVEVMQALTGIDGLTRKLITEAAPHFNRENPELAPDSNEAGIVSSDEADPEFQTPGGSAIASQAKVKAINREQIEETYLAAKAASEAAQKVMEEAKAAFDEAVKAEGIAYDAYLIVAPKATPMEAIRAFQMSQLEARKQRAAFTNAFVSGYTGPVSALDAALRSRPRPGQQRPSYPLLSGKVIDDPASK